MIQKTVVSVPERLPRAFLACVAACLVVAAAGAADDADLPDPTASGLSPTARLDALVERVQHEQSKVDTLQARFEQHKESALLLEPEEARGVFYYRAPDQVRWEYAAPDPIVMTISGEEMLTYYPDLERAESVAIGRYSEQVFKYLGATGSIETLKKYFTVTADFPDAAGEAYHLTLHPRYARIKKRIESMELWIDADSFLPTRFNYVQSDGDVTEYRFADLEVNVEIPRERFLLDLPAGVEVKAVDLRQRGG